MTLCTATNYQPTCCCDSESVQCEKPAGHELPHEGGVDIDHGSALGPAANLYRLILRWPWPLQAETEG
jgi:hypothetical protein